jgi:hypothetical protein
MKEQLTTEGWGLSQYLLCCYNRIPHTSVRKMIFSIKVFVTLLDYLKTPQVAILVDLHI